MLRPYTPEQLSGVGELSPSHGAAVDVLDGHPFAVVANTTGHDMQNTGCFMNRLTFECVVITFDFEFEFHLLSLGLHLATC
jgi:hypothetical protein